MNTSVHIDGKKIQHLRKKQGLTQLYLATVVGVTTDTISRWENRRYPSIKRENGLKLAEALNVPLEVILQEKEASESPDIKKRQQKITRWQPISELNGTSKKTLLTEAPILLALCFACVLLIVSLNFFEVADVPSLQAVRRIPAHTAPGTSFPVLITLTGSAEAPLSILLREELSCDCETSSVIGKGVKKYGNTPRWIGRVDARPTTFSYVVHTPTTLANGTVIHVKGDLVTRKDNKIGKLVGGADTIRIAPYHWADINRDYTISDEEILMVYEEFAQAEKNGFSFEPLEELWLAGHYSWNEKKHAFETDDDSGK